MRTARKLRLGTLAGVVGAVALAGCGSKDDNKSSTAAAAPASAKPAAKKPTGTPIVVADISDTTGLPGVNIGAFPTGAAAAVDYINNTLGGVAGRPLKLWTCNSKFDPAAAATCANGAIAQHAVAQVGASAFLIQNGSKALHLKGIATLNVPNTPQDFGDKMSYPIGGGGLSEYPAQGYYAARTMKAKKVSIVEPDFPAGHLFARQIAKQLTAGGVAAGSINTVYYAKTATDVTPAVIKAVGNKPDVIIGAIDGPSGVTMYRAFAQQGYPASKILAVSSLVDKSTFEQGGATFKDALMVTQFRSPDDTANPDVKIYRDAMAQKGAEALSTYAQWGFANIMMVYRAAKAVGAGFDAKGFADYMKQNTKTGIPVFMGPTLKDSNAPPGAPAIRNTDVIVVQWDGEKLKAVTPDFFSASAAN